MVNPETIRNTVGVIGNVISFGLFLSPLPTILTILKRKAVEQYSPVPYLATFLNCLLWCFYGLPIVHPNSFLIITINGTGLIFETVYLTIFLLYSDKKQRANIVSILVAELAFVAVVAVVVLKFAHTHEKRSMIVGILCVIFGTCMYASPLAVMKTVIQTKSVKYMPFTLSFVSFLNGICWTTYALIQFDIFITIPNGLGTMLGLVQLIIYAMYFRCTPQEEAQKEVEMA